PSPPAPLPRRLPAPLPPCPAGPTRRQARGFAQRRCPARGTPDRRSPWPWRTAGASRFPPPTGWNPSGPIGWWSWPSILAGLMDGSSDSGVISCIDFAGSTLQVIRKSVPPPRAEAFRQGAQAPAPLLGVARSVYHLVSVF